MHVPPRDQKVPEKNIRFAELDIPRALGSYAPKLNTICALLLPDQEMDNWINKEIAIAKSKVPLCSLLGSEAFRVTAVAARQRPRRS